MTRQEGSSTMARHVEDTHEYTEPSAEEQGRIFEGGRYSNVQHQITSTYLNWTKQLNFLASVHERTTPTDRRPFVGEVSANVAWSARRILTAVFSVL
jgi:hypothetical protein